ncbi:hypothetical protein FLA_0048 [Filimonas lacunae]|nr:hypothetical protein FLA_0048 [Filimonas lacunae]
MIDAGNFISSNQSGKIVGNITAPSLFAFEGAVSVSGVYIFLITGSCGRADNA